MKQVKFGLKDRLYFLKQDGNELKNQAVRKTAAFRKTRKQDKGMALITVIIIIAVLALIATTLADVSVFSYQRKVMDTNTKQSFYSAEGAMDDVRIGLQKVSAANLDKISDPTAYINGIKGALGNQTQTKEKLLSYITSDYKGTGTSIELDCAEPEVGSDGRSIVIKNVTIGYTDAEGFYSQVKCDLRMQAPKITTSDPVGSYSTIAGSGIAFQESGSDLTNNGYDVDCSYVNLTSSVYIGYQKDELHLEDDIKTWTAITLDPFVPVTYSGPSVTVNGNIYLKRGAILRLEAKKVDVYGAIVLEPGAVLIVDQNTTLKCHGLYKVSGTEWVKYGEDKTGIVNSLNAAIKSGNNYYGHVPYTYPFIYEPLYYPILKANKDSRADKIAAVYPDLDQIRFWVPDTLNMPLVQADGLCCYADSVNLENNTASIKRYVNNRQFCCMNCNLSAATVLIGTKCDEANGYVVYKHAGDFSISGVTLSPMSRSLVNNKPSGEDFDYSGVAYPVYANASGAFVKGIYGKTTANSFVEEAVSNIIIDANMRPADKVQSKYGNSYAIPTDEETGGSSNKYFDPVVYNMIEMEYAADFGRSKAVVVQVEATKDANTGKTTYTTSVPSVNGSNGSAQSTPIQVNDGEMIKAMVGTSVQPTNDGFIMLVISTGSATIKDNSGYLRGLYFANGQMKFELQGKPSLCQSIITQGRINAISDYLSDQSKTDHPGKTYMENYDKWGKYTYFKESDPGKNYFTSDKKNGERVVRPWASVSWSTACSTASITTSGEDEAYNHIMVLDDWFKSGVKCLYMDESQMAQAEIENAGAFSIVTVENWSRQ